MLERVSGRATRTLLARATALGACLMLGVACNAILGNREGDLCGVACGPDASLTSGPLEAGPAPCPFDCSGEAGVVDVAETGSPACASGCASDAAADTAWDAADAVPPLTKDCGDGGVRNDPYNCGTCGNVCEGGVCTAGVCGGGLLVGSPTQNTGLKSLYGLAVVGDTLYGTDWYENTLVYSTSTQASVLLPDVVVYKGASDGSGDAVLIDGNHLLYTIYRNDLSGTGPDVQGVWTSDLTGANASRIVNQAWVDRLAVLGQYLYWSDGYQTTIYCAQKDGTAQSSLPADLDTSIVAINGYVYFLQSGQLVRATPPLDGVVAVSDTGAAVVAFAVDSSHAFWIDANGYLSERLVDTSDLDGGGASVDVTPAGLDLSITKGAKLFVDDGPTGSIYYAQNPISESVGAFSLLYRATKGSRAPATLLVSAVAGFGAFAQDSQTIYFTTYGQDPPSAQTPTPPPGPPFSAVWKVAK